MADPKATASGRVIRSRESEAPAGGTVAAVGLAYSAVPHQILYEIVPGYDRFRASPRWLFLLPAFALPLAALGLQDLLAGVRRARIALAATAGAGVLAVAGWFAYAQGQPDAPVAYFRTRAPLAVAVVAGAALVEVAFHTARWYPSVRQAAAYPDTRVSDIAHARGGRIVTVGVRTPSHRSLPTSPWSTAWPTPTG